MKLLNILSLVGLASLSLSKVTIDPSTRTFRDSQGRARIFHGTNVVVKGYPYLPVMDRFDPQLSLNDQDIQNMKDWGIHLVRLGVMWESVEVAPLQYNYTYLQEVDKLIHKLGENGIYTMVDAHQDLFSKKTCGEGMPAFYANDEWNTCPKNLPGQLLKLVGACKPINDYGFRRDEQGLPVIEDCLKNSFIKYYTSPEVAASFEGLYFNQTIQQRFVDFWDVVSKTLASNKHIIGYDPINEPWPANFYKEFSLLYSQQKFDREVLFPLLRKVHDVIRNNVGDMIYFFEPAQFPDTLPFFGGIVASIGFPETPGGEAFKHMEVLNDHTYCCQAAADMCDSGEPPLAKKDTCRAFHANKAKVRSKDAEKFGVPLVFSEFGACANTLTCYHEITSAADAFDDQLASWMYWMYKGFGDFTTTGSLTEGYYDKDGNLQQYKVLALQRTFIHAFQGTPISMKFMTDEKNNGTFIGKFQLNTNIDAATEVFLSTDVFYRDGYKISVLVDKYTPDNLVIDDSQKNYLKFKISDKKYHGQIVSVVVTPVVNKRENVVSNKEYKVTYHLSEQQKDLMGVVYFKINGIEKVDKEAQFELIGADNTLICKGKKNHQECFTYNYVGHDIKLNVFKEGYLWNTQLIQLEINKLNGHIVEIEVSKL